MNGMLHRRSKNKLSRSPRNSRNSKRRPRTRTRRQASLLPNLLEKPRETNRHWQIGNWFPQDLASPSPTKSTAKPSIGGKSIRHEINTRWRIASCESAHSATMMVMPLLIIRTARTDVSNKPGHLRQYSRTRISKWVTARTTMIRICKNRALVGDGSITYSSFTDHPFYYFCNVANTCFIYFCQSS